MEPELKLTHSNQGSLSRSQFSTGGSIRYRGFQVENLTPKEKRKLAKAESAAQAAASTFRGLNLDARPAVVEVKKMEDARNRFGQILAMTEGSIKPLPKKGFAYYSMRGPISFYSFAAFIERIPLEFDLKKKFESFQLQLVPYLEGKDNIPTVVIKYLLNEFFQIKNAEGSGSDSDKNAKVEQTVRDILNPGKWIEGIFKHYPKEIEHHVRGVILDFPILLGMEHPNELESQEAAKAYTFISQLIAQLPYGTNRNVIKTAFEKINQDLKQSTPETFYEILRDLCLYAHDLGFHFDSSFIPKPNEILGHLQDAQAAVVQLTQKGAFNGEGLNLRSQVETVAQFASVNPLIAYCAKKNDPAIERGLVELDKKINQLLTGVVADDRRAFIVDQLMTLIYEQVKASQDLDPDLEQILGDQTRLYKILTPVIIGICLNEMRDQPSIDKLGDLITITNHLTRLFGQENDVVSDRLILIHRHLSEFDGDDKADVIVRELSATKLKELDAVLKKALKEMLGTNYFVFINKKKIEEVRAAIGQRNARAEAEPPAAEAPAPAKGGWGLGNLLDSGINMARRVGSNLAAATEWGLLPLPSEPKPIPSGTFKSWLETLKMSPLDASVYLMKAMHPVTTPEQEDHYIRFYRMMNLTFERLGINDPAEQIEFLVRFIFGKETKPVSNKFNEIIAQQTKECAVLQNIILDMILVDAAEERKPRNYIGLLNDLAHWFEPDSSLAILGRQFDRMLAICQTDEAKELLNGYVMNRLSQVLIHEDPQRGEAVIVNPEMYHRQQAVAILSHEFEHPAKLVLSILKESPDLPLEAIREMMKSVSKGMDQTDEMFRFVEILDEALSLDNFGNNRFEKFETIFRNELRAGGAADSFELLEKLLVTIVAAESDPASALIVDTLLAKIEAEGLQKYVKYMEEPYDLLFDAIRAQEIVRNEAVPLESLKKVFDLYVVIAMMSNNKAFGHRARLFYQIKESLDEATSEDKAKKEYQSLERNLIEFEAAFLKSDASGLNVETVDNFAGPLHLSSELSYTLEMVQKQIVTLVESGLSKNSVTSSFAQSISNLIKGKMANSRKFDLFLAQLRDPLVELFHGVSMSDTIEFALKSVKDELLFDSELSFHIYRFIENNDVADPKVLFLSVLSAKKEILREAYIGFRQGNELDLKGVVDQVCDARGIPPQIREVLEKHVPSFVSTRIDQYNALGEQGKVAILAGWQMEISQDLPLKLLQIASRLVVQPHFENPTEQKKSNAQIITTIKTLLNQDEEFRACLAQMTQCGIPEKIQEEILTKLYLITSRKIEEYPLIVGFDDAAELYKNEWLDEISAPSHPIQEPLEKVLCEPLMDILRPFILDPIVQLIKEQRMVRGASLLTSIFVANDPVVELIRDKVDYVIRSNLTSALATYTDLRVDGWALLDIIEKKLPSREIQRPTKIVKPEPDQGGFLKAGWNWLTTKNVDAPVSEAVGAVAELIQQMLTIVIGQVQQERGMMLQGSVALVNPLTGIATNKITTKFIKPALDAQNKTNFSDVLADVLHMVMPPPFPDAEDQKRFEDKYQSQMKWLIEHKEHLNKEGVEGDAIRAEFVQRSQALKEMIAGCEFAYDPALSKEYSDQLKSRPEVQEFLNRETKQSYLRKTKELIPDDLADKRFNTIGKVAFKPIISSLTPMMQRVTQSIPDFLCNDLTNTEIKNLLQRLVVLTLATQLGRSAEKMRVNENS